MGKGMGRRRGQGNRCSRRVNTTRLELWFMTTATTRLNENADGERDGDGDEDEGNMCRCSRRVNTTRLGFSMFFLFLFLKKIY